MFEVYTVNRQVPKGLVDYLEKGSGERTFLRITESSINAFIVLNNITKNEIKEFKGDLSVIFQDYEIPFLTIKYKTISFNMPIINKDKSYWTNILTVFVIDSKGYVLRQQRVLGLEKSLVDKIINGAESAARLSENEITRIVSTRIYPKYSNQDMCKGGIRQRFVSS